MDLRGKAVPDRDLIDEEDQSLVILTCSMARDLELFGLLAESVDRHVEETVRHVAVVPGKQIKAFRPFESSRRLVIAQEDILPLRFWKAPDALKHLALVSSGFRRPIYLDQRFRPVRGWMIQQLVKLQFSRQATTKAVMHCDSDMAFVRAMPTTLAFPQEKPLFFRVSLRRKEFDGDHRQWLETAASALGTTLPQDFAANYVDNAIVWSTAIARDMADRIEATTGGDLHDALLTQKTISEYYLYGVYLDLVAGTDAVSPRDISICRSLWRVKDDEALSATAAACQMRPDDVAVAIQSTVDVPIAARRKFLRALEAELSHG